MEYFLVRNDSRVVNYDRRGFIRLATGLVVKEGDPGLRCFEFEYVTGWIVFNINLLQKGYCLKRITIKNDFFFKIVIPYYSFI